MGKCKFSNDWLKKTDGNGHVVSLWCKKEDDKRAYCIVCMASFSYAKGFQCLQQHADTIKHRENSKAKLDDSQLHLTTTTSQCDGKATNMILKLSDSERARKAEIIWALKNVSCNWSAASCNGIEETFRAMFGETVPNHFSMGETKLSYLVGEALGPYFREMMLNDAQGAYFAIQYDETTNAEGKKELQIALKYWSKSQNLVVVSHLETIFMGHAKGEQLSKNILQAINNAQLPISHLLMIGSDGPNVSKTVWRAINEKMKVDRNHGLMDVGTCSIHTMHNAFLKGLEQLHENPSEFVLSLFYFFKNTPTRCEDFEKIQAEMGLKVRSLIKHVPTRWLTLEPAAERVIYLWPAIEKYFLVFLPKNQPTIKENAKYKTILQAIKNPTMQARLYFVISLAKVFTKFTGHLQREEPLIHVLYDQIRSLLLTILGRFLKKDVLKAVTKYDEKLVSDVANQLSRKEMECGEKVRECLLKVSEKNQLEFLISVQNCYIEASKYIMKKTPISQSILKHFRCLQPIERTKQRSSTDLIKVASALPIKFPTDILLDEWKLLQFEEDPPSWVNTQRIENYWNYYFDIKNGIGERKYPNVTVLVKASLTLSHGSADVERGFSKSSRILTEDKASMSVKTLNARLIVSCGLKQFQNKPELVPITKTLLKLACSANQNYKLHLEKEKELKIAAQQKHKENSEEAENQMKKEEQLKKNAKNIKTLEAQLIEKQEELEKNEHVSDKFLIEANERLKKALKNKDLSEISLAQSMIDTITRKRAACSAQASETCQLMKTINKRKTDIISYFVEKRKKTDC